MSPPFVSLPRPPIQLTTFSSISKNLGLLRFYNSKLTLLGQLRVRNAKLTKKYVKDYALWQLSFVSLNFYSFLQNPIYITINNSLSSINFHLGLILEVDDYVRMIVDSSATMKTGNKDCHSGVISQYPAMVT